MASEETSDRIAARIVLVDGAGRTLLFNGGDPARPEDGTWWFTPGGGVEQGERFEEAARRELFEETGVRVDDVGPIVHERRAEFRFGGRLLRQLESYYLVRIEGVSVDSSGWTELERRTVDGYRWWSIDELRTTDEVVYPTNIVDLLQR